MSKLLTLPKTGILIFAILTPTAAFAENWVKIGTSSTGTVYYFDSDSIATNGSNVSIWSKSDHSKDRTVKQRESKTKMNFDCDRRTVWTSTIVDYDASGRVIQSFHYTKYENPERDVVPGSVAEAFMEVACLSGTP